MRKKTIDLDEPIGKLTRMPDFLPASEDLAIAEQEFRGSSSQGFQPLKFAKIS